MIQSFKNAVKRYWPRLRLRTILLSTLILVAALPGFGALFLRVYENTLVRQTEAELIAQGAALAAAAAAQWPSQRPSPIPEGFDPEPLSIDLKSTVILADRPLPTAARGVADPAIKEWAAKLVPILRATNRTTLASLVLLDGSGRILTGRNAGLSYAEVPEVMAALAGRPATALRHNDSYRAHYAFEWLSRASNLRIHHARPIIADGHVVGVLVLSRSPRALFLGIYEDRGKIAFGVVSIFIALLVLSGLLSRGIARPIEALSDATRAVARGDGSVPEPPRTAAIEIQALYEDFAAMAEAIAQRSQYLRDFAHAVSHEFKTPLAGIRGAIELLQDHPEMPSSDRERFLGNAAADAERLTHLVTRLLELARADMAERSSGTSTDLTDVLRRVADANSNARFKVALDLSADLPPTVVPVAAVEAALSALMENSCQAGAHSCLLQASTAEDDSILLHLSDDGPGISPGDRARVFEPFFTTRRAEGGTGLGLSITRSLLQSHAGSIDLDHTSRRTQFRIRLPATNAFDARDGPAQR